MLELHYSRVNLTSYGVGVGVLTKPDTIPPGATKSREMWLDIIEGRRHQLKHGYFCTRQPDDDKRLSGVSPSEARAAEAEFFKTNSPWSTSISLRDAEPREKSQSSFDTAESSERRGATGCDALE